MKKIAFILILMMMVLLKTTTIFSSSEDDQLIDLTKAVKKQDLSISEWQVTKKDSTQVSKAEAIVKKLKQEYDVDVEENQESIKYVFMNTQKKNDITEDFKVIVPKKSDYKAEVVATISGTKWNKHIKEIYDTTQNQQPKYLFTENAHKFACVSVDKSGIIKNDVLIQRLTKTLKIKHITTQTDNLKRSTISKLIYGYTPIWNQAIKSAHGNLNVQIALKKHNQQEQVLIGTPILINEY